MSRYASLSAFRYKLSWRRQHGLPNLRGTHGMIRRAPLKASSCLARDCSNRQPLTTGICPAGSAQTACQAVGAATQSDLRNTLLSRCSSVYTPSMASVCLVHCNMHCILLQSPASAETCMLYIQSFWCSQGQFCTHKCSVRLCRLSHRGCWLVCSVGPDTCCQRSCGRPSRPHSIWERSCSCFCCRSVLQRPPKPNQ